MSGSSSYFVKKLCLIPMLVIALWLLSDNKTSYNNNIDNEDNDRKHHLAVSTALYRHPPCLRIYRALFEINLMIWCIALSLYLWEKTIGQKMIGYLLFQSSNEEEYKNNAVYFTESTQGSYQPIQQQEETEEDANNDKHDSELIDREDKENQQMLGKTDVDDNNNIDHTTINEDDNVPILSTQTQSNNFEYIIPPSSVSIANGALDLLLLILISLFLFTLSSAEGGRYVDGLARINIFQFIAFIAAPIFPLLLFIVVCIKSILPYTEKRQKQWQIVFYTIGAPMYHVTFRDGFIGDILTSSVRPLQDITFTIFYILSGLQGWWKQSYDLDAADLPLESNWLLHTCILPMCMISPLWWRFCQNLRQAYDYKKRWPYLGNALKYFIAAEVAVFGVYMQTKRQSTLWLSAFVIATLYQIWWDVFMDWELLHITKWKEIKIDLTGNNINCMYVSIPTSMTLRKTRIYSVSWIYWSILTINIVLRFCWTLSFLPPHYLNQAGVLSETFDGDLSAVLNPTIASAEIIRRMLWGWLRVEWEAIKVGRKEPRFKGPWRDYDTESMTTNDNDQNDLIKTTKESELELHSMPVDGSMIDDDVSASYRNEIQPTSFSQSIWIPTKMYNMTEIQILGELCIYATLFTGLGLLAAAHRDTL